jgi:hypothetical protein
LGERQKGLENGLPDVTLDLPEQPGDPDVERVIDDVAAIYRRLEEAPQTDEPPTRWPEASGRVLVEVAGRGMGQVVERTLREQGYQVAVCGGPAVLRRRRCPLVQGDGCPLADGADLVVYALDLDDADDREVLEAHRAHPERRACVVVPPALVDRYRSLLEGYEVVEAPLTPRKLTDALQRLRVRGSTRRSFLFCLPEHQRRGRLPGGWDTFEEDTGP